MDTQIFYEQVGNAIAAYLFQELKLQPNIHYRIVSAQSGPRVLSLSVSVNPRYSRKIAAMSEELSMASGLDKGVTIRVNRGNRGTLALEIPKPQALWFDIGVANLPRRRGLTATVGLDNEHRPTAVNFSNPLTPHALLAGTTGSGKTNCLKLLTFDLASQNEPDMVEFVLIDTRKRGANWRNFARIPHLAHPVVTDNETALRALSWAVAEIDRRAVSGRTKPRVFVGIDECQDLLDKDEFVKVIGDIAATGREFGIHLLVAMQNPTAKQLGDTNIKRNLACRLVGKVDSATAAVVATGQADTGAATFVGAGDKLFEQPMGIKRLTAALLTEKDTDRLPRTESVKTLDLGQYEDVDHIIEQANRGRGREPEPLKPAHVALAMTANRGITWLAQTLSIGSGRAKKVLGFAKELHSELSELGYTVIPYTENTSIEARYVLK